MKNLWFKKRYVEAILSGEKTTTIRAKKPTFDKGGLVNFQVGPKSAFATVNILAVSEVPIDSLDPVTQENLRSIYGSLQSRSIVWRIRFQLV